MDQVRAGIIGYGGAFNMGKRHGESMVKTGKMTVAAVCDIDKERAEIGRRDFPGCSIFYDPVLMLQNAEVDLCIVILPHNLHAPMANTCMAEGKHVITEKPMCLNDREAQSMISTAFRNKVMLSVFHNRRWDGDFMALQEIVESGLLGEIYHIEMYGGGYNAPRDWWRSSKEISGGLFFDWGAHYLDWLLQIVPEPVTGVTGFFHKLKWDNSNEDNVEAALRFANGTVAHVQWSSLAMAGKERWRLLGSEGSAVSDNGKFIVNTNVHGKRATIEWPHKESNWDAFYANIAAHLCDGEDLVVKPEQARRVIAVMDTAEKSSKSGVTESFQW